MFVNHTKWMNFAILQGFRSKGATGKNPPVGCVIVKNDILLSYGSTGLSGRPHAEEVAINNVANKENLVGSSMYVTLEPCHMCAMAIIHARIKNVFYGAREPKFGAIESVDTFFEKDFLNHKVNYSGGYLEQECSELLKSFFLLKR